MNDEKRCKETKIVVQQKIRIQELLDKGYSTTDIERIIHGMMQEGIKKEWIKLIDKEFVEGETKC